MFSQVPHFCKSNLCLSIYYQISILLQLMDLLNTQDRHGVVSCSSNQFSKNSHVRHINNYQVQAQVQYYTHGSLVSVSVRLLGDTIVTPSLVRHSSSSFTDCESLPIWSWHRTDITVCCSKEVLLGCRDLRSTSRWVSHLSLTEGCHGPSNPGGHGHFCWNADFPFSHLDNDLISRPALGQVSWSLG